MAHLAPFSSAPLLSCRRLIQPGKEVPLRPGDLVSVAVPDIAFEVQVLPPPTPAVAASNGTLASTAAALGAEAPPALEGAAAEAAAAQQAAAAAPPVVAALRLCGALEAAAATQGQFPPGGAVYADLPDRARQLMTAGRHDQAYVLLLAGAMQKPWSGGLWAQLANLERQRARRGGGGGSYGVARAFSAAPAASFAALTPAWAGGALRAGAERAEGLVRVYSSWGQMEQGLGHASAGRTVLRRGLAAAREHPAGVAAAGAPRLLVSWAAREWKAGDGAEAQRLCVEALEAEPTNPFALTQLASIEVCGFVALGCLNQGATRGGGQADWEWTAPGCGTAVHTLCWQLGGSVPRLPVPVPPCDVLYFHRCSPTPPTPSDPPGGGGADRCGSAPV
mgnify:CR=1 FL=1